MKDNFYITTPIYYVNDKPHIGHAYTTILADVLARYHRLLGVPTHFLTGTDEHGQKVQNAAAKNGETPLEHCNNTVVHFQKLWERLGITNDDFIRTTEERHIAVVSKCLQDLWNRGEIYKASYKGWYCVGDERYYTEKDLVDGHCPDCGRAVEQIEEPCYKFKMSKYQDRLIQYIEEHPKCIQPDHFRNETLGFLKSGPLDDLCISRPKKRLSWGIDLPFDHDFVTYVWFDALVNYISAVGYGSNEAEFKKWWPVNYHLIGKDILTTHTVYWPTMLMAMGIDLPMTVFAHGWWLTNNSKMSKSLGNVVNPMDMIDKYGVDAFRYYLIAAMSLGQDANFTEELFANRYNAELANDLGNLISRALTMLSRFNGGKIPAAAPEDDAASANLRALCMKAVKELPVAVDEMHLDAGLAVVMAAVREGNRYWTEQEPWKMAKEGKEAELACVLRNSLECLRVVSGLLYPVMPAKMEQVRKALGMADTEIAPNIEMLATWNRLVEGAQTELPPPMFPRVKYEPPKEEAPAPVEEMELIGIEDFGKVSLKTAKILAAEPVPEAVKLLKLQISLGTEERQIVSGIAQWYKPEELVGKTIVVVANLKPAMLRGVESKGMLLAAKKGKSLRLVTLDGDIAPGTPVG